MNGSRWRMVVWLGLLLCGGCVTGGQTPVALRAQKGVFQVLIPGSGELRAVKSTPISVPPQVRGRQTIAWIAPDNANVRQGEVVVRLDAAALRESLQVEENQMAKLSLEIRQKEMQLEKERGDLHGQLALTEIERNMADVYAARDETIFPRNKIIEDAVDLGFLTTKERHFEGKKRRMEKKATAELQLLQAKMSTRKTKADQLRKSMDSLEMRAPHDGVWVVEKTWRGEKYHQGMNAWGGEKLGTLPDFSLFEAKVFVLESASSGLVENLPVSIRLDFEPDREFRGKVLGIDTIAKAMNEESVIKYFEVRVGLDAIEARLMKPGIQVKATIFAQQKRDVISVPNQALLYEEGEAFLKIKRPTGIEKRKVETGLRSLTRTVITRGLREGEEFLLDNARSGRGGARG